METMRRSFEQQFWLQSCRFEDDELRRRSLRFTFDRYKRIARYVRPDDFCDFFGRNFFWPPRPPLHYAAALFMELSTEKGGKEQGFPCALNGQTSSADTCIWFLQITCAISLFAPQSAPYRRRRDGSRFVEISIEKGEREQDSPLYTKGKDHCC